MNESKRAHPLRTRLLCIVLSSRQLMYTALSRAQRLCILVGDNKVRQVLTVDSVRAFSSPPCPPPTHPFPLIPTQGMVLAVKKSISHARHTLLASRLQSSVEEGLRSDAVGVNPSPDGSQGGSSHSHLLLALARFYNTLGLEEAVVTPGTV